MENMRLYTFTHFMLSPMAKGIQSTHSTVELFNKYQKIDLYDYGMSTGRNPSLDVEREAEKAEMLYDWSKNHKTIISLNAGNSPELIDLSVFLSTIQNPYPWASFHEDESLGNQMTSISLVLPEKIYEFASMLREKIISRTTTGFVVQELNPVNRGALLQTREFINSFEFSEFELELIDKLNTYRMAT